MNPSRRPAGTPGESQFAPTNRPKSSGVELVYDTDEPDRTETPAAPVAAAPVHGRPPLTANPALARLDEKGRRFAESLGYAYAAIDAVDEHHGLTTPPNTLGFVTYDDGKSFIIAGTRPDGTTIAPFGLAVFTPFELDTRIDASMVVATHLSPSPASDAQPAAEHFSQANTVRVGFRSPWGTIDDVVPVAIGIDQVGTPGHGGVKLSAERNRAVHEAWRRPGGWYEEDCEWAIAVLTFPDAFSAEYRRDAVSTARNYFPDEYEAVTGETIRPGESYARDEATFFAEHANDWVTTAALAAQPGNVEHIIAPDGLSGGLRVMTGEPKMVKVWAKVGGRRTATRETRVFLVPADDYAGRDKFGFVLDPDRYEEVAP